jgi:hypothetical protein
MRVLKQGIKKIFMSIVGFFGMSFAISIGNKSVLEKS